MITLRFYRIYDIGREIDLDWLKKALAHTESKPCCHAGEEDHVCCGNH